MSELGQLFQRPGVDGVNQDEDDDKYSTSQRRWHEEHANGLILLPPRPEWHLEAACRGMHDWFHKRYATQQRICAGCPVVGQCLDDAKARGEEFGTWGGVDFDIERRRQRARQRPSETQRRRREAS